MNINKLKEFGYNPTYNELKSACIHQIPLLNELVNTPQDKEWHGEGNVEIHVEMVLNELYLQLESCPEIIGDRRLQLVLGTFLHDIAKPLNTQEFELDGKTRIGARDHEYAGMNYLAYHISTLHISNENKTSILELVSEHGSPKPLVKHWKNSQEFTDINFRCDTELLYLLELADWRGRYSDNVEEVENMLHEFKYICEEYDCFGPKKSINYSSDREKYVLGYGNYWLRNNEIHQIEEANQKNYEEHDNHSNFIMMCGIAGAGKSSLIKEKYSEGYEIISLDEIRSKHKKLNSKTKGQSINEAQERLKECLREKRNVVFDATNIRKETRGKWITIAINYRALVTVELMLSDIKTITHDDRSRTGYVGSEAILSQFKSFQYPNDDNIHYLNVNYR